MELKIGIIGVGHIAQKAYLPFITQVKDVELHICTRNVDVLEEIRLTYKHPTIYEDMDAWLNSGITAAFVHAATDAHEYIIDRLLDHGIHVFVDKPITDHLASTKRLIHKAKEKNSVLMVGFNRRYAPSYEKLKEINQPNMVIVQKNVAKAPGDVRSFIFNDFIHVIDTMLYLFPYEVKHIQVSKKMIKGVLHHVSIQLQTEGGTAIGIMNRDVGVSLEKVEIMSPDEIALVENVDHVVSHTTNGVITYPDSTWTPTLGKRGFEQMIQLFMDRVQTGHADNALDLQTHEIAEQVVQYILEK